MRVHILLLCAFVVAASAITMKNGKIGSISAVDKDKLCSDMAGSLFNPMRCADPEEDLALPGKEYLANNKVSELDPVILLPGIGGSSLDAKLHKTDSPAWYCFKTWDWFRIWFRTTELLSQTCWMDNLAVTYNETAKTYDNTYGVNIRPTDFGGLEGVDYLDYKFGIPIVFTSVYAKMVKSMVEVGYVKGKNLRGAPYDWRLPAAYLDQTGWYDQLENLIVETYTSNGNKPVHIVGHSLGCPTALYFLNKMPQEWLNTYIKSFIPIAGPWSGAGKSLRAAISGDNFGLTFAEIEILSKKKLRGIARQAGGLVQLFPDNILWSSGSVWVSTPTRNYTAQDYVALFNDIGYPATAVVWEEVNTLNELTPPNVPTYCIYGYGIPTEISYYYADGFEKDPVINNSDLGDGTVPLDSLRQCEKWDTMQTPPINVTKFNLIGHGDIIKTPAVIQYVISLTTR